MTGERESAMNQKSDLGRREAALGRGGDREKRQILQNKADFMNEISGVLSWKTHLKPI